MHLRGLYAITPDWPDSARVLAAVDAALEGGVAALQFRRKHLIGAALLKEAHLVAERCRHHGVPLIINDDPRLARECGAEGVHLGQGDGSVAAAREVLGAGRLIGVSCYGDINRVIDAEAAGADYAAMGSLFPSRSKPFAKLTTLAALREARSRTRMALVGIGGINADNAVAVKLAGADMIAVIGALFESGSVREAASFFSNIWERQDVQPE